MTVDTTFPFFADCKILSQFAKFATIKCRGEVLYHTFSVTDSFVFVNIRFPVVAEIQPVHSGSADIVKDAKKVVPRWLCLQKISGNDMFF